MIILDGTIVNVALPAIQDDLGFSQSDLAWVVNAYLIAFGGLLLLAGRLGDLVGRTPRLPRRARRSSPRPRCCAAWPTSQAMLIGARFAAGRRRRDDLGRDPRDDRDDVPRAARAGEGDRRLQLRRLRGRLDRPARRRRADRGAQLALDLLRQRPDRRSRPACSRLRLLGAERGPRPARGRRRARRRARHRRPDARRVHDRAGRRARLGLGAHARARRRLAGAARPASSPARRPRPRRCCRCGCFARAPWPGRTPSRC